MMATGSVISSSCPSLPISHCRPAPPILFQQQPPTGAALNKQLQRRRRRPSPRHVVASVATTDRWAPAANGDVDRTSHQLAEMTSGRSSDNQSTCRALAGDSRRRQLGGPPGPHRRRAPGGAHPLRRARAGHLRQLRLRPLLPLLRQLQVPVQDLLPRRRLRPQAPQLRQPPEAQVRRRRQAVERVGHVHRLRCRVDRRGGGAHRPPRHIAVAWRGTITRLEWAADLTANQRRLSDMGVPCPDPRVKVEMGFAELYTSMDTGCRFCRYSAREQALAEVRKLVELYHGRGEEVSVTVTGHSLGSALAMLNAFGIAETGANATPDGRNAPVCVFSFAGPRVGNLAFKRRFEQELGVRVVNVHDTVPKVPGVLFNEAAPFPEAVLRAVDGLGLGVSGGVYAHLGVLLELDHKASPFLKKTMDISCYHNLEAHLHLLDGFRGAGEGFELRGGRDPALVNKSADFLRDDHMVPPVWYQAENKGMVRTEDGSWVLPPRHRDIDQHPEDTEHHLKQLGLNAAST
ncbi:unnamed protein product [Urochloa decumbens]|uniref:Fungal lipase-type domain-containing protein n=1 Tax=Urochloa decumbens TaxID=240449 RepID=A0ABC8ZKU7_9POAL